MGYWVKEVKEARKENALMLLVGNKADLEAQRYSCPCDIRTVSTAECESVAKEHGIPSLEVSAKTGVNIDAIFTTVGEMLISHEGAAQPAKDSIGFSFRIVGLHLEKPLNFAATQEPTPDGAPGAKPKSSGCGC